MKALLLDSSMQHTTVALKIDDKLFVYRGDSASSSSSISAYLERALDDTKSELDELDFIVLPKGGGSYTGLRICYTTAFGISTVYSTPLIQINPLDCFAYKYRNLDSTFIPVLDVKRHSVMTAFYYHGVQISDLMLITIDELSSKVKDNRNVIICGYDSQIVTNHNSSFKSIQDNDIIFEYFELAEINFKDTVSKSSKLDNKSQEKSQVKFGDGVPQYTRQALE